ncbi:Putative deoxyribonuclease RhsC [Marinomonas gallaica]|uniref:Deoxyribonuclease RhsC n=1 Tax=Marinomonas gallaica TaxID=1806667 RepID=A0A1C3JM09_9GAMM|nr:RHS repeat-associated core domain-containing protein [Marinomonas gallaica]SBT16040.1 Putative deoxyribonuclease RhsC [Marinomonas gallaica]SBT21088.1 Putative deoxyribonuclease RhsC [Marinomonas gallaica]
MSVQGPQPETFVHDPAGNLLSANEDNQQNEQPATEQDSSRQVTQNRLNFFGDQHYAYDDQGNRTQTLRGKGQQLVTHFTYDALNQLTKVEHNGVTTTYEYDPLGRRIAKRNADKTTTFLWNDDVLLSETTTHIESDNQESKEDKSKQTEHKTYLFEPDSFNPVAFVQNNEIYHYHTDHLGTPQDITNAQGNIVWSARYRAYGNLALADVEEVENNLRFQGQYFDEETGLHYNRFRYYDPNCGRFINQDPIGLLGGLNCYQYVPNPVQWVDPLGLSCKENFWNQFQKDTKGHFANSAEASKSYQKMKEVAAMGSWEEKVNRPDPSTYLPQTYIDAHLDQFNQEGAGFVVIGTWISNPKYPGFPPRKFVGLKSEMDAVIDKYHASGNDWRVIRDELSLGANVDLEKDEILYVTVDPSDDRFTFDMPTGREAGAYEGEWVPGGKTKGGTKEAALVGAEDVLHDNSLDELATKFTDSKKIK